MPENPNDIPVLAAPCGCLFLSPNIKVFECRDGGFFTMRRIPVPRTDLVPATHERCEAVFLALESMEADAEKATQLKTVLTILLDRE